MPLQLVNLDDKTFEALVTEAVRAIPRQAPDWTNHNRSDPGITFIELFAWLAEMEQYHINQIGPANMLKYLKLLGERPRAAAPSRGYASFAASDGLPRQGSLGLCLPGRPAANVIDTQARFVDRGTKLAANGLIFETTEHIDVLPVKLVRIATSSENGLRDNTERNLGAGLTFVAFGDVAEPGSQLYLGFNQAFPPGKMVNLMFYLSEDGLPPCGSHGEEEPDVTPSATLIWEYSAGGGRWARLEPAHDETLMLSQSGRVRFIAPYDIQQRTLHPFPEQLCWLRCRVEPNAGDPPSRPGPYEVPPRLSAIELNAVPVRQTDTLSETNVFSGTGEARQSFTAEMFLALAGFNGVQVREEDGAWIDWADANDPEDWAPGQRNYTLVKSGLKGTVTVNFGAGSLGTPPPGKDNVRLISYSPDFRELRLLGASSGLPCQSFRLEEMPIIGETLLVQVGAPRLEGPGEGQAGVERVYFAYRDWTRVDDLDGSGPGDMHYVLDAEKGEIRFGDGVNGGVPPVSPHGEKNIRLIAYQVGGGVAGNVAANSIKQFSQAYWGVDTLLVNNGAALAGGRDAETLEDAQVRARANLKVPWRAVTDDDFVYLAEHTPGLRVNRAHAMPLGDQAEVPQGAGCIPAVNVIVVPYSPFAQPVPSAGFLNTVCRHLDRHRLLTAQVNAIAPQYVAVNVQARIALKPGAVRGETLDRVRAALDAFLSPLRGGPDNEGWPFGRAVYRSDIYQQIESVEGVECVEQVTLTGAGQGAKRENGNITIPTDGLVSPGAYQIEAVAAAAPCQGKGGAA